MIGLIIAIVSSTVGAAAWITTRVTRVEVKVEDIARRVGVLEARDVAPMRAAPARRKKK